MKRLRLFNCLFDTRSPFERLVPRPISFFQKRNNFRGTRLAKASQINYLCANQRSYDGKDFLVGALVRQLIGFLHLKFGGLCTSGRFALHSRMERFYTGPSFRKNLSVKSLMSSRTSVGRSGMTIASQKGLTLVEIIVVIVILVSLFAFLSGTLTKQGQGAVARINELKMSKLKAYIDQYSLNYGTLPPTIRALTNCEGAPQGRPCTPFAQDEDVVDSFGTPYTYSVDQGSRRYTIKSLGGDKRDGGSGTDADVILQGP
jgi:general secretion pathway protein G